MDSICILGAGATGLLLLLLLQEANADLSTVTIIDPHFDGGDLARKWTSVISNTPWSKTINALQRCCPSLQISSPIDPTSLTPLVEIAHLLRTLAAPALKRVKRLQGRAIRSTYDTAANSWTVEVDSGGQRQSVISRKLVLAPGGEPRTMDLPIPSIPLEIALDADRLKYFVKAGQHSMVFGTMHSGTLVIRNLVSLGARVTAYYNTDSPFYWDRDGIYDGVKAEAAAIADDIVAGKIPVTLVSTKDTAKVIRTSHNAEWVVYAMGFSPRDTIELVVDGSKISPIVYDGKTGKLPSIPAWGFGIAYPNRAPDGVHWDVSVASFLGHMKHQLPNILE